MYLFSSDTFRIIYNVRLSMKQKCSIIYALYFHNLLYSHLKSRQPTPFSSLCYREKQTMFGKNIASIVMIINI